MHKLPNPDLPFEQWPADILFAACLWGEARGSGIVGMAAVACVITNRMKKKNKGSRDIILAPWQFSSFNASDPNSRKLGFPLIYDAPEAWHRAFTIASLALEHALADITKGATHYFADSMPSPPKWADPKVGWKETAKIGGHTFGITP